MAVAAVLATALTTQQVRAVSIFIDNLDVVGVGGVTSYGTPLETVEIEEQGPDGVSSASFTIDDPSNAITITEGQLVRIHDHFADLPMFLGYVQAWGYRPFGLGRQITVQCVGIEALLDWAIVPTFTMTSAQAWSNDFLPGLTAGTVVILWPNVTPRMAYALPVGLPQGRSNIATPIENVSNFAIPVSVTNVTVRELFRQIYTASGVAGAAVYVTTVDFWGNLRVFQRNLLPTDYANMTVSDTYAGAIVAADLSHEDDASGVVHRVYVIGTGAPGTGLVSDGSTIPGPIPILQDSVSVDATTLANVGGAYLADKALIERGTFRVETWRPTANIRAGCNVTITDSQVGLSSQTFAIRAIRKTFDGAGLQTWGVTYGSLPPRMTNLVRRMTRTQLS